MDPNSICRKSRRLAGKQREICRKEIEIVEEVANGAKLALNECQYQFRNRMWNCTTSRRMLSRVLKTGMRMEIDDGHFSNHLMAGSNDSKKDHPLLGTQFNTLMIITKVKVIRDKHSYISV
jgi:hypothetical protein